MDRKEAEMQAARSVLSGGLDRSKIAASFLNWWLDRMPSERSHEGLHEHLSTVQLSRNLQSAGLDEAAGFVLQPWVADGPIHPGKWQFAILLGESNVELFIMALCSGNWADPNFFGLEEYGAWEAFDRLLRQRLRSSSDLAEIAFERLLLLTSRIDADPVGHLHHHAKLRSNLEERIAEYRRMPQLEEVSEGPFDGFVQADEAFLWSIFLELRPDQSLALLGNLPHPVFPRSFLYRDWSRKDNLLAGLIARAPVAFKQQVFQKKGAVVILLLEQAASELYFPVLGDHGPVPVYRADEAHRLEADAQAFRLAIDRVLDAVFARVDAVPVAWTWLARLITCGWPRNPNGTGQVVNAPLLFIEALAKRLSWRDDWESWIQEEVTHRQIYRAASVLMVGTVGSARDTQRLGLAMEAILLQGDVQVSVERIIADPLNVVRSIGGQALCALDNPPDWFDATWNKLRPLRERNWHLANGGGPRNDSAEILVMWGFAADEMRSRSGQSRIWSNLEVAVRDAWQTDRAAHAPVWPVALKCLFADFPAGVPVAEQLAPALFPYIAAEYGFLSLIAYLVARKWNLQILRQAVEMSGFDLPALFDRFVEMKMLVVSSHRPAQKELEAFRDLAKRMR